MQQYLQQIIAFLKTRYGIEIVLTESIEDNVEIAELVNKKIIVNTTARDSEAILFVIAHLFGHMVQFTNYEKYRLLVETVERPKPLALSNEFKQAFYKYEVEAYKIGKGLLESIISDSDMNLLDEHYQIYLETDFNVFWEYLTTGDQASISEFNTVLNKQYAAQKGRFINQLRSIALPDAIDASPISAKVY